MITIFFWGGGGAGSWAFFGGGESFYHSNTLYRTLVMHYGESYFVKYVFASKNPTNNIVVGYERLCYCHKGDVTRDDSKRRFFAPQLMPCNMGVRTTFSAILQQIVAVKIVRALHYTASTFSATLLR